MTEASGIHLLEPETIGRLGSLDFIARSLVEGFLVGLHRSPYHGFSVEFAEYRQYQPGEPAQNVDWRVYAKTDRHYVKIYHEETNLLAHLLLDCSASMGTLSGKGKLSKLDYAKLLAAALSYLFIKQNDAAGLVAFDRSPRLLIPARASRKQLMHLLTSMQNLEAGETTDVAAALHQVAERVKRRGLVILLSDLIDDPARVLKSLKHFRHRQHEVLVFHILHRQEVDLDFNRQARFVDPEGELNPIEAQPWHLRDSYVEQVEEWRRRLGKECRQHSIDYVPLTTDTPFETALLSYLNKRARLR